MLVDCLGQAQIPGGAPANVACHVAGLGGSASLVSRVGHDPTGIVLADFLNSRGIGAGHLQVDDLRRTGAVRVMPGPCYEIAGPAAWDFIELTDGARAAAKGASVVVFGTLAQRQPVSRRTIRALVETAREARVPALCDLNLRAPFFDEETALWCLRNCDVLKLNRGELDIVSRMLHAQGNAENLFAGLLREFGISCGVLTDGEHGAWFCQDGNPWHHPAEKAADFCDAVGAGDACSAVLALALSRGLPLHQAAAPAAGLAAFVTAQPGATPRIPASLAARLNALLGA